MLLEPRDLSFQGFGEQGVLADALLEPADTTPEPDRGQGHVGPLPQRPARQPHDAAPHALTATPPGSGATRFR
jgi:hypothetical protein